MPSGRVLLWSSTIVYFIIHLKRKLPYISFILKEWKHCLAQPAGGPATENPQVCYPNGKFS